MSALFLRADAPQLAGRHQVVAGLDQGRRLREILQNVQQVTHDVRPLAPQFGERRVLRVSLPWALGILIGAALLLALLAVQAFRQHRSAAIKRAAVGAFGLVIFQALLGMWTVTWLLKPIVVMGGGTTSAAPPTISGKAKKNGLSIPPVSTTSSVAVTVIAWSGSGSSTKSTVASAVTCTSARVTRRKPTSDTATV